MKFSRKTRKISHNLILDHFPEKHPRYSCSATQNTYEKLLFSRGGQTATRMEKFYDHSVIKYDATVARSISELRSPLILLSHVQREIRSVLTDYSLKTERISRQKLPSYIHLTSGANIVTFFNPCR